MKTRPIQTLASHPAPVVSVPALADYLEVDERTILRMISDGSLRAFKAGRHWRIETDSARRVFRADVSRSTTSSYIEAH